MSTRGRAARRRWSRRGLALGALAALGCGAAQEPATATATSVTVVPPPPIVIVQPGATVVHATVSVRATAAPATPSESAPELIPPPTLTPASPVPAPVAAPPVRIVQISTGSGHVLARMADGTVRCAGSGCGEGCGALRGVASVAGGYDYSCVVMNDHTVQCWGGYGGFNESGVLGDGTETSRRTADTVPGVSDVIGVFPALGEHNQHTCAVRSSGAVTCWGDNGEWALGNRRMLHNMAPVAVPGLGEVVSVQVAPAMLGGACALTREGRVRCWGATGAAPARAFRASVAQLGLGEGFACARLAGGEVQCAGENDNGQLGVGTDERERRRPTRVINLPPAQEISVGSMGGCALDDSGAVWCWGLNSSGEIGDGTVETRRGPVRVPGLQGVAHISSLDAQTCALRSDGAVLCWGNHVRTPTVVALGSCPTPGYPAD